MLNELNENQSNPETEEEKYRREYGNENVDALKSLIEEDYERAMALANAGELSENANHRLSAMYIKAMIAVDRNDHSEAEKAYDKLITFDPGIADKGQAAEETKLLVEELNNLRNS